MNSPDIWILSAIIGGGLLAIAGGGYGIYCSIKNTNGPRERRFTVHASVISVVAVVIFIALRRTIPSPHNELLWIPYAILLPIGIHYWNKTQAVIREQERQNKTPGAYAEHG